MMKTTRPLPYKDTLLREQIADYVHRRTGVLLTKYRIGRDIRCGAIRTIKRPRIYGGGVFTRKAWLEDYIRDNSG